MFVGHTAVALAAKKAAPEVSLGLLLGAAVWLDLVWPIFLLLAVEHVRIDPGNTAFTPLDFHLLPVDPQSRDGARLVGGTRGGSAVVVRRRGARLLLGGLVFSHWVLDVIVHRSDLPLWPGASPKVGFGLWNSVAGTIIVEGALLLAGLWLYLSTTQARDRIGRDGFWALIGLYIMLWLGNLALVPPPDARSLAWFAMAAWLLAV